MTDFSFRNPSANPTSSYANLESDLFKLRQARLDEQALNEAAMAAAALNKNLPYSINGQITSPDEMLQLLLADIERNPQSSDYNFVKKQLAQNPLVLEMAKQGRIPASSINDLAYKLNQRHIAKKEGRAVYNPEFGDQPLTNLVEEPNREDAGFLDRTIESTADILGLHGRRELESDIARVDEKLSRYPTEFKLSFAKYQEVEKAKIELENLRGMLQSSADPSVINQLQQRVAAQADRLALLQSHITSQDHANVQRYGQSFLLDWREREGLKARENLLTPRYPTTAAHEREIASVRQKHLAMGHSASFSDPASWTNGFVKDYMLTYADPDVLAKEVAPEVLPWVGINFMIDAGAAALTGGASLPASIAKWTAMIGMGANSAYQAIDKNIDQYFEQHGTTAGFSELRSYIMEGIAFGLDMYGGRMISHGFPAAVDKAFNSAKKEAMASVSKNLEIGQKMAEATGSAEPFKAAVKQAYQVLTGSSLMRKIGESLSESGAKSAALQGRGKIRQLAGAAISGTEKPLPFLGRVGIEPTVSATTDAALSLAAENMMSETARQVGRQNGMNADAIIESGLKGIVAGPIGRAGGKVLGAAAEAKQRYDVMTATKKDMLTDQQLEGYSHHIDEAINSDNLEYKKELYKDIKSHRDELGSKLNEEQLAENNKSRIDNVVEKYQQVLPLEKGEVKDLWVNSKGEIVNKDTEGALQIKAPEITVPNAKTDAMQANVKALKKDLQKEYKRAYNEVKWKDARQAQQDKLQSLMTRLEEEGKLKEQVDFIESTKKKGEIEREEAKKDEGHSPLANTTAREVDQGKKLSKYEDISSEDLMRLNTIAEKSITRDVVDRFNDRTEEERKDLHKAIVNGDVKKLNELLQSKKAEGEEAKSEKPLITQEQFDKYKNDIKDKKLDMANLSEADLRDLGIIKPSESVDMEQLQKEVNQISDTEAAELQKADEAAKQAENEEKGLEGKEAVSAPVTVSETAQRIKEAVEKHNNAIEEKGVTGTKEVTALEESLKKEVEIKKVGGKDTVEKVRDNKYNNLKNASESNDFWKGNQISEEDKQDLLVLAKQKVTIPVFHSNKKAIKEAINAATTPEEFTKAISNIKGINVQKFMSAVANDLYTAEENRRKKIAEKIASEGIRHVGKEVHSYVGYAERTIVHNYFRAAREERPESKALNDKIKQYDGRFLFDRNLYNDEDYLNFVVYVCKNSIFKEGALSNVDTLRNLLTNGRLPKDDESAKIRTLKQILESVLIPVKNENGDTVFSVSPAWMAQLDLLTSSLLNRSNSGTATNFKILGDYLSSIKSALEYLIEKEEIIKDTAQYSTLWTGSSKYHAKQWFAGEKAREYRADFSTADKFRDCNFYFKQVCNAVNPEIVKQSENYSQIWKISDIVAAESDSDDVLAAIKTWINSQSLDTDFQLLGFFKDHSTEVFHTLSTYWIRDAKNNIKASDNIINALISGTKDPDIVRFLTVGEEKASDIGTPGYWKRKWNSASDPLKGRLVDALLSNPLTLAACLGIKGKHADLKLDATNYGRVVNDMVRQLQKKEVQNLIPKGMNEHLQVYFYYKLYETNWIDKVTFNELLRGSFQKDLREKLRNQLNLGNTFNPVDLYFNKDTTRGWYVSNEYLLRYRFNKEAADRAIEQSKEDLKKRRKEIKDAVSDEEFNEQEKQLKQYYDAQAQYEKDAAEWKEAFDTAKEKAFDRNGSVYKQYVEGGGDPGKRLDKTSKTRSKGTPPTSGKYAGLTWDEVNNEWDAQYRRNHPEPPKPTMERPKLDRQFIDFDQFRQLEYRQKGTDTWTEAVITNGTVSVGGNIIASQDRSDLAAYTAEGKLEQLLEKVNKVNVANLPATENKSGRTDVTFTGPYAERLRQFYNAHYGQLIVYKWLSKNDFSKKQDAATKEKWLKEFSNVFSYLNETLPTYNARKTVSPANITYKDLDYLIDVIQANGASLTKEQLMELIKANKKVDTGEIERVVDQYFNKEGKLDYSVETESTEAQRTIIAQALQYYINKTKSINNSITGGRNGISFVASRENTLSKRAHDRSNLPADYFKKRSRKSILLHEDGFANAAAQNPDLVLNEAFRAMVNAAKSLYGKVIIPDSAFAQAECDYTGRVFEHTINVAVAAGISTFARTSSETSEDFLNQLRISAPGAWRVYSNPNNHIIDQNNFIESVGKMAAKVLGFNPKHIAYDEAVARLGQLAVLGLESAKIGFERVYINRFSGNIVPSGSKDKTNCIPAIRINDPVLQSELTDAIKSTDADGITRNWVDKLLDVDFHNDDSLHTKDAQIIRDVYKFAEEYNIEYGNDETVWFNENDTINAEAIKSLEGEIYQYEGKNIAKVVKLDDMAMVCLLNSKGEIDVNKLVVFNHDAIEKTDYTKVSNTKLVTLAAQMVQGVDVNLDELFKTYVAMGILVPDGDNYKFADGISEEEVNRWDLDQLDNFLEKHPFLQMMLFTNSKYGMDPNTRSGKDRLNTRMTNLMDFRKMVKDITAFTNIEGKNYFNKADRENQKYLNLYFSEMNTVNNRLFVKSSVFNYREFKHWRSITSVNRVRDLTVNLKTENQKAMFAAPILFNLGFDVDKIASAKEILKIWNKLNKTKEFKALVTKLQSITKYDDILKAIKEYNKSLPAITPENRDAYTYSTFKGAIKDKPFKISTNYEAVTTLSKMKDIKRGDGTDILTDLGNLDTSITGYDITVEVDGLTNGPSFKNIGSPLISNTDYQSHFLLGATGASNIWFNIREAYEGGILDTYNLNGQFVRDSLTVNVIKEFFRGSSETSNVMRYLQVLYKPSVKEKDGYAEPANTLDNLAEVLASIFDRDFMKPPTMVIGYEAGKASVIQTLLSELDRKFSNACASNNRDSLKAWHEEVMSLIGKNAITAEYVIGNSVKQITIYADGTVALPDAAGGATHISKLSKEQMDNLSISHTDIPGLRDHLSNLFGKLYDSIAAKKELIQKPYQQLGECAQALANAFDTVVRNAINSTVGKDGIPNAKYLETVDEIVTKVETTINAIINVGVEKTGNKSLLSLTKEEVKDSVIKAMSIYTTAGKDRFVKSTVALAGKVSLGAGTVPMFIHSYDSSVVHTMLQKVMDVAEERILTIHDALLANITQLAGEWETSGGTRSLEGVKLMNQGHYESGHEQIRSFADICQCLHNAINSLEARKAEFNLPDDSFSQTLRDLKAKQEMMFKTVISLASQRRAFYERQKALADQGKVREMWHDYQYSNFGDYDSGEALGGFVPTSEQLAEYINAVDSIMNSVNFPPALTSMRQQITKALKDILPADQLKSVFGDNGEFTPDAAAHFDSLDSFFNWLTTVTTLRSNKSIQNALYKSLYKICNDPEIKIRTNLIESLRQSEQSAIPNSEATGISKTVSFLQNAFKLLGDTTKDFGREAPTRLLITDDNNILHNRAIEAVYALSKLPSYIRDSGTIGQLLGFREMTHLHKESSEQSEAFMRLITPFHRKGINLSEYDANKSATVVYSDSFDFVQLESNFRNQVNRQHYLAGEKNFTYYMALSNWYSKLKDDMREMIRNQKKEGEQFVFTLRSQGDIFRMLALQDVISSEEFSDKNFTISVIPAISNLSQASAAVDEEVAVYQKLTNDNDNLRAVYFTGTVHSHNVQLQQAVMGFNINPVLYEAGALTAKESTMLVMDTDKYATAKKVNTRSLYRNGNRPYRRDELNNPINSTAAYSSITAETDLLTAPIHGTDKYGYNIRVPYSDSFVPAKHYSVMVASEYFNSDKIQKQDAVEGFDEILGNDDSTVIVQTEAGGEILSKGLTAYANTEGTVINAAYKKYKEQQEKKWRRWEDSNHSEYEWKVYMTPIIVSVPNYARQNKVFVFMPVIDNTVSIEELKNGIVQKNMNSNNRLPQIIEGSSLSLKLQRLQDENTVTVLDNLRMKHKDRTGNYRVIIPTNLMPRERLWEGDSLNPIWLKTNNATYLKEVFDRHHLAGRGIRIPVDSFMPYDGKENIACTIAVPKTDGFMENLKYVNLANVPLAYYKQLIQSQEKIQFEDIEDRTGSLVKDSLIPFVGNLGEKTRSYMGKIPGVNKLVHGYVGTVSNIPREYAYKLTDDILAYDQADAKFRQLMVRSIERDRAKGIDTSLVEQNLDLMDKLVTLAYVRIGESKGIESSLQATLLAGEIGEREFLNIGTTGTYESEAEAFMHEMLHTLWRHLNASNPGLRKKLSDMYNYVSANFNINYFEDGNTLRNQQIMEAVFGKDTVDNVEEFLCYYLTNRAFHNAVNAMAEQKHTKLSEVLESNTKGIFRKLLNTAQNFLAGKLGMEKQPDTIEGLAQKALSVALNYNNKYWLRKQNLIESATKEEISTDMILGLKEPAYKVLDKLYDDSVFTKSVQLAVQKVYKAFGIEDKRAVYASAHIGATEEFNRITETGEQLADNLIEAKRDYLVAEDGFVNDLLSSLEGVSRSQYDYLVLRTKSKAIIDQQREQMGAAVNEAVREVLKDVPEKIAKHLTMQFIHTDMSCLFRNTDLTLNQIKKVLTDKQARAKQIASLERIFATDQYGKFYKNAAKGLAQYLVTGFNPTGLNYRNAYEILSRAGSQVQVPVQVGSTMHNALDQLISLYALDMLDTSKVNVFESVPIETLNKLSIIHNAVKDADNKEVYFDNSSMHLHVPKGELHGGTTSNRYEIIPAEELEAYEWNGYKKVSDAELDPFFKNHTTDKYVMVRAAYKSPAVTTAGIFTMTNIFKGRTQVGINIGSVLGRSIDSQTSSEFRKTQAYSDLKAYIQTRIENLNTDTPALIQKPTSGNMLLNFNIADHLAGATFEVNPIEKLKQTGRNVRITSVLGDLYGSTIERTLTPQRNAAIAQSVIDIYESATDKENFVWVAPNSENEKYRDLYDHLPFEVKKAITEKYGERGLPVRLKALNTVFGYANLSANDTKKFIEEERKAQNNADKLASQFSMCARNIFYNKYFGNAETLARWLAKVGKTQVVIKGITTSWFNVLSNCVLLSMNGLSAKQVLEYQLDGLRQFDMLRQYKYQLRQLKQKQLLGQYTDADARAEANINKSIKSLPVYDLIENGVIANTIAEDRNESEALVQNIIKSVFPKGIAQTVANNFMITPNSYLYQVLADFASLGDIGGKWALYRYNIERKMDKKEAARLSLNAFIDYSNPLPKQLQLVDDFAVLPFMKYALGIQNMLMRTISKHPDRTLAWVLGINSLIGVAHPFQSLLSPQSVYDRMQLPGELFADSFGSLPSNRLLNWYGEVNP